MDFFLSAFAFFVLNIPIPWIEVGIIEFQVAKYQVDSATIKQFFAELRFPLNILFKLESTAFSRNFHWSVQTLLDNPSY